MKKRLLMMVACLMLCLTGCSDDVKEVHIDFPFEVSDVEKMETYHYDGVPAAAELPDGKEKYTLHLDTPMISPNQVESDCCPNCKRIIIDTSEYENNLS